MQEMLNRARFTLLFKERPSERSETGCSSHSEAVCRSTITATAGITSQSAMRTTGGRLAASPTFYGAITVSLWTSIPFTMMETVQAPGVGESWLFQNQKECR
jgi:hypothetical protein